MTDDISFCQLDMRQFHCRGPLVNHKAVHEVVPGKSPEQEVALVSVIDPLSTHNNGCITTCCSVLHTPSVLKVHLYLCQPCRETYFEIVLLYRDYIVEWWPGDMTWRTYNIWIPMGMDSALSALSYSCLALTRSLEGSLHGWKTTITSRSFIRSSLFQRIVVIHHENNWSYLKILLVAITAVQRTGKALPWAM